MTSENSSRSGLVEHSKEQELALSIERFVIHFEPAWCKAAWSSPIACCTIETPPQNPLNPNPLKPNSMGPSLTMQFFKWHCWVNPRKHHLGLRLSITLEIPRLPDPLFFYNFLQNQVEYLRKKVILETSICDVLMVEPLLPPARIHGHQ